MVLIEGLVCVFRKTNPNPFTLPLQYEHPEGQIFKRRLHLLLLAPLAECFPCTELKTRVKALLSIFEPYSLLFSFSFIVRKCNMLPAILIKY